MRRTSSQKSTEECAWELDAELVTKVAQGMNRTLKMRSTQDVIYLTARLAMSHWKTIARQHAREMTRARQKGVDLRRLIANRCWDETLCARRPNR